MKTYAAMDVGSNQLLLYIAKVENNKIVETLLDKGEITKLGEGVNQTGVLKEEAMDRTFKTLKDFKKSLDEYKVVDYKAVGTSALREAQNSSVFLSRVKDELGLEINVIPGEEEARFSYLAVVGGLDLGDKETAVVDIGGGSTEFIFGKGPTIMNRFSLKIGSLKMTEQFLKSDPVEDNEFQALMVYLKEDFERDVKSPFVNPFLVGVGGTMTNLGAMYHKLEKYNPDIVHGTEISLNKLNLMVEDVKLKTIEEKRSIKGLQPKRVEVILAGMGILKAIMERLNCDNITVSDRGLRHGLFFESFCS